MIVSAARSESWAAIRARMLQETEAFINEGLRNPERIVEIPVIEVGTGSFSRAFAQAFWARLLADS